MEGGRLWQHLSARPGQQPKPCSMCLVLAADWAWHWYCHNHLPSLMNSHYITRLTNMSFGKFFALNEDLN